MILSKYSEKLTINFINNMLKSKFQEKKSGHGRSCFWYGSAFFLCCFVTDLFHMKYFCRKKKAEKVSILKFVLFVLCHVCLYLNPEKIQYIQGHVIVRVNVFLFNL